jgi:uncharacterized membrane protein YkgB
MKFLKENLWWIILIVLATALFVPTIFLPDSEVGQTIKKILLSPFYIIGAITIIVGIGTIINYFGDKFAKHTWQLSIVLIILVLSLLLLTNVIKL